MGCKRIYSAHVCLPKPRLLRRRREELHEHHRHTILLAFSTLLLIQLRRRESTIVMAYTSLNEPTGHISPRTNFPCLLREKKKEAFLQIEIRGGIVLGALKYPLKIWLREGRGERVREKGGGKKMSLAHHLMVHLPWQTPLSWRERKRRRLIIIR